VRRFVLQHSSNFGVIEADFQRGCRDHDVCIRIDSRVLRTRASDANSLTWREDMSDVLDDGPVLTLFESFACVRKSTASEIGERTANTSGIWTSPRIPSFGVQYAVEEAINDVQVVREGEHLSTGGLTVRDR